MKFVKVAALLMSLSMVGVSLCACSNEPEPVSSDINIISTQAQNSGSGPEATDAVNVASENFAFNYNGYDFIVDTAFDESKLPEDYDYKVDASCAFTGDTESYVTHSFNITLRDNSDIIYLIWIKDDTVSTAEGIRIGNTIEEVKQVYGEPDSERINSMETIIEYKKGSSTLQFVFNSEGKVSSITYFGTQA